MSEQIQATTQKSSFWRQPSFIAFGLYTLLTLIIIFPLPFLFFSHLRGGAPTSDSYQNIWYLWWYGRAIERGFEPSHTDLMYGLLPNVQVLVSSVLNGILMWPIAHFWDALPAYNLAIIISYPLAGFFTYRLALEVLDDKNQRAAFAAGFFFSFSTYHFYRMEGHLGLLTIQWLPFYLWRLFCLQARPSWSTALLAALGLALASLSDLYYLGYFVVPVTALFVVWLMLRGWKNWRWLGLTLLVGGLSLIPFYAFFLNLDPDIRQAVGNRSNDVRELSADLLAFVVPNPQNPLLGGLTTPFYANFQGRFPIEQAVFCGYILLVLALSTIFLQRQRKPIVFFLLTMSGLAFVMALGPRLHVAGTEFGLPLPYTLYNYLPLLNSFRAPNRFGIVLILGLAILAAFTLSYILKNMNSRRANLILVALLSLSLVENITFAYPLDLAKVEVPGVYTLIIPNETDDFLILELPLDTSTQSLFYQTQHEKRLVGGVATRISNRMTLSWDKATYLGIFNPAESSAVINNGEALNAVGGPEIFPLDLTFRQMLVTQNIRFVTFRAGRPAFAWIQDYLIKELGYPNFQERLADGNGFFGWRIAPDPNFALPPVSPNNYRIRLGDGWNAGLGKGQVGRLLRLAEQDARLLVTPGTVGLANLEFDLTPYIRPQTIEVRLNGQVVGRIAPSKEWELVHASFQLNLHSGENIIELHSVEGCLHPVDYIPNSVDLRCISFAVEAVQITPHK